MDNKVILLRDNYLRVIGVEYNYNNLDDKITDIEIMGAIDNKNKKLTVNINNLHQNVRYLHIEHCNIDSIELFPIGRLDQLQLKNTNIHNYDNLPDTLTKLCIYYSVIDNLNNLPPNLEYLYISSCKLLNKNISNLPKNLKKIHIFTRQIFFGGINPSMIEKENITLPNDYCVIEIIH